LEPWRVGRRQARRYLRHVLEGIPVKLTFRISSPVCALIFFFLLAAVNALAQAAENPAEPSRSPLPLGTVTVLGPATCLSGATSRATCTSISVSCPGIPDLGATISEAFPTGTAKGTIILVSGGDGTTFFNSGFPNTYLSDGFRVVQLAWASEWELTGGVGLISASCRGATVFKYVFDNVQAGDRSTGFCAQGTSGGGGAIAYSLAQYGMSGYFDYVVIAAGPGVSRMDYGCDKSLYTGPPLNLCTQLTNAPYTYFSGAKVNSWENTTSCDAKPPLQSDINKWAADSIVTSGANYSYPQTAMSFFMCVTPPVNNSTGQGKFLIDQVVPKNNSPEVNCYSGICKGEAVWQDKNAYNATLSEMLSQCVPNHQ
jgi:hypothetical protein